MKSSNNEKYWKFSSIPNIEESNFNRALEKFYNLGISGLVRENIQNSLDAKLRDNADPVIVTINTGRVNEGDIPGINEIKYRINCLEGRNSYTKETIDHMRNEMNPKEIDYISFEDCNTKGLTGAKNGQSDFKEDTWGIYAYNKGIHLEENDDEMEKYRGGSHGIGKIASNAASDLFMIYFANCDEYGEKHLGGTVQLIEHKYKDNYYRSTGYFTDYRKTNGDKIKFYPYENKFNEIFQKNTRGLKIVIPFLKEQFNNEKEIIKSVCDSFFIAIIQGRLEVIVNNNKIDNSTIKHYILNDEYYVQEIPEIKKEFTPLYYDTYTNMEPKVLIIKDINKEYKFNLYFNYNELISKGRVAIIRTIGMKIEDKKVLNNVNKPFNAILVPVSSQEDAFLKSLENESHTELSFEHIKNQNLQKNAKRFINNISREISKIIEEEIRKKNPTDGAMDTKDILYIVENQFKQDLSKTVETVKLNKGKNKSTIVKVTPDIPYKRENGKGRKRKPKRKSIRKVKLNHRYDDGGKAIKYYAHPDNVKRLILENKELLRFDFVDEKDLKGINSCDISFVVIDGMGNEYVNEFNLKNNYETIIDISTGKECKIENNIIRDIKIKESIVQLELILREEYNRALKFVYYMEV